MENIQHLIEKYFEGESSHAEEQEIRRFFAEETIPEDLIKYKTLFAYFDREIRKEKEKKSTVSIRRKHSFPYFISAFAACVLLLIGIAVFNNRRAVPCSASGNYVIIDGQCYSDDKMIKSMLFEALCEVAEPINDYLPNQENIFTEKEIMNNQLKELSNMFAE